MKKIFSIFIIVMVACALWPNLSSATVTNATQATGGWFGETSYDTVNNVWLVVSQADHIQGRLMDTNQQPLGEPFNVSEMDAGAPSIDYSPDAQKFLVIWVGYPGNGSLDAYARFVSADKTMSEVYQLHLSLPLISSGGEKTSALKYDSKNKKFVLIWENRGAHHSAMLTTIDLNGTRGAITEIMDDANGGIWNPAIAVNPNRNEYCAVYDMRNGPKWGLASIDASNLSVKHQSVINETITETDIAYNTNISQYLVVSSLYDGGVRGRLLNTCQTSDADKDFWVLPNSGAPRIAFNQTSNTFGVIAQNCCDGGSNFSVLDASGQPMLNDNLDLEGFGQPFNGQFVPTIAANPGDGTYAVISDRNYGPTYFLSSVGSGVVSIYSSPAPLTSPTPITSPQGYPGIGNLIAQLLQWSIRILGIAVFIMTFYGGLLWFLSRGNSGQITQAKNKITNAILGAILLLSAYLILYTVNPDLVRGTFNLPGVGSYKR